MENFEKESCLQLSLPKILMLSFTPGLVVLFTAIFFLSPFYGIQLSYPMAGVLAMIIGHVGTELGILKFIAAKENKKIKDIIQFKNKTPLLKLLIFSIIPIFIALIVLLIVPQYEEKLWKTLKIFDFMPDWIKMDNINISEIKYFYLIYPIYFLLDGLIVPIIEELYFRGYLLPRMEMFGKIAPLVNAIIFSMYHLFSPDQNITRILFLIPMVYSVWINRNIKIGIIFHCTMNVVAHIFVISTIIL